MSAAYFITLDNPDPGFDPFVNGKAIAREASRLKKVASLLNLKAPDDYVSVGGDEALAMANEFGLGVGLEVPPTQWFDADEGLRWVEKLGAHIRSNPKSVKDSQSVLGELAEYERVLSQAKTIRAKWHLSVDF